MALATVTSTALGFTYAAQAPLVPLISDEFQLDDLRAGLLVTALFLSAVATILVAADVPDRYPPKNAVTAALALALAGNLGSGLAPTYETLLLARAVGGVGAGFGFLGGLRYIARRYEEERSHFGQGLYGGGFPFGSAIALWAMAPLGLALGWRGAFLVTSIGLLLALLAWLVVEQIPAMERPGTMLDAVRCPNCWWASLQHAAGFGLTLAAGSWVTVYLLREFQLPLDASGLLGSILLITAVLARPIGGFLLSRQHVGSLIVMRAAQISILVGIALLAAPGRPLLLALLGTIAVGFGGGFPYAAVFNTAGASLRAAPAAAQGLTALGGMIGTLVGAPAMGYATQTWGFSAAWLFLGTFSLAALLGTFAMTGEEELITFPPVEAAE